MQGCFAQLSIPPFKIACSAEPLEVQRGGGEAPHLPISSERPTHMRQSMNRT